MSRCNCVIAIGAALLIAVFLNTPLRAQPAYGIEIVSGIETDLPTTSSGGGGQYLDDPPPIHSISNSYVIPPYGHADSVTAVDPTNGGLYTVSAVSEIHSISAENGRLSVSSDASTYTADINVQGGAQNESNVLWNDFLIVSGLKKGTAVTLEIRASINGILQISGGTSSQGIIQFITQLVNTANDTQGGSSDVYFDTSSPFSSTKTYLLNTYSGVTLSLLEDLTADLSGNFQYSGKAVVNGAHVTVVSLTKGVLITSVSGISYAPKPQVRAPNTINATESEAEGLIASSGLSLGRVSTMASDTVKAGAVIEQIPAPETEVDEDSPVDLVVSSGPAIQHAR